MNDGRAADEALDRITLVGQGSAKQETLNRFYDHLGQSADRLLDRINRLLEYMIGTLMLVLVVITFTEVVRRYVFNNPTSWSSELCRFILIWMTFTGASIVTRHVTHLTMGFTIHRFVTPQIGKVVKVFVAGLVTLVMAVITFWSAKVVIIAGARSAPMTAMPMYFPWAALPFNAAVMTLYMAAETIKHIVIKPFAGKRGF